MKDPSYEAVSKAKRQAESGNPNGAVETLESYLEKDPRNIKARMELAKVHVYHLKDIDTGIFHMEIVLDTDPENIEAMKAMVTVLAKHKKYNKKTSATYEKLLPLAPEADVYNAYAIFLRMQMTDFKKSAEYYVKAISLKPNDPIYRRNYAVLLLNDLKDYEGARDELETLLRLDPGDVLAKKNYDLLMEKKFDSDGKVKKKTLFRR
jgi:tetratricopeptide (TPR) repeat protein